MKSYVLNSILVCIILGLLLGLISYLLFEDYKEYSSIKSTEDSFDLVLPELELETKVEDKPLVDIDKLKEVENLWNEEYEKSLFDYQSSKLSRKDLVFNLRNLRLKLNSYEIYHVGYISHLYSNIDSLVYVISSGADYYTISDKSLELSILKSEYKENNGLKDL